MALSSRFGAGSLAIFLSAGAFALAAPGSRQAAVEVVAFEVRQGASLDQVPVPPERLLTAWPYALSRMSPGGLPPMGSLLLDAGSADLRKKTDAPTPTPLERLTRLVNVLAGDAEARIPSYFLAGELEAEEVDEVASELSETLGGHPRKWRSSVAMATRSILTLVDAAWMEMEALIQDLPAQALDGPFPERVASLQLRLEGVEGRRERLRLIRKDLEGLAALGSAGGTESRENAGNPFPEGLRRRRI